MKRLGGLWQQVVSFDNLLLALQRELLSGEYQPGEYRLFNIYERKPRTIAAAPFRDRVVHHALLNVIEPPIDRRFIHDSYACRTGKGVHAAVNRYQSWARHYTYALKMDIARYFPSIDHDLLKAKLRRLIKERKVLALLDKVIDHGPPLPEDEPLVYFPGDDLFTPLDRRTGLPIGNLTSQFFANLYLDDFDHWVKEGLQAGPYLRYVDDMVILDNDKGRLAEIRLRVREALGRERLMLHPRKAHVVPVAGGLDLLGYRVFPNQRRLRNDNGWRFIRKMRGFAEAYAQGVLDWDDFNPAVQSWIGHASHADTWGLRKAIFSRIIFTRGSGRTVASG